jgi:hypothetical protein
MAKAAIMGESKIPKKRYKTPTAIGIPKTFYKNAKTKFCMMFRMTGGLKFLTFTMPCKDANY